MSTQNNTTFFNSSHCALPEGNLKSEIVFNIDNDIRFTNPFSEFKNVESMVLYEKYLSNKNKKYLLHLLTGKKIISNEDEEHFWTRREVIEKLRKINGLSKNLASVNRHALNNRAGFIFNMIDLNNFSSNLSSFNDFNKELFDLYPDVKNVCKSFSFASPGMIRVVEIKTNDKIPLKIVNLFKISAESRYKIFDKNNFKRLTKKFKKMNTATHIPIFIQERFGDPRMSEDQWNQYKQNINKHLPQAIICRGK